MSWQKTIISSVFCTLLISIPIHGAGGEWEAVIGTEKSGISSSQVMIENSQQWKEVVSDTWQAMDDYNVAFIRQFQNTDLSHEERLQLLDNLIESRYQFEEGATKKNFGVDDAQKIFEKSLNNTLAVLEKHAGKGTSSSKKLQAVIESARETNKLLKKDTGPKIDVIKKRQDRLGSVGSEKVSGKQKKKDLRSFFGIETVVVEGDSGTDSDFESPKKTPQKKPPEKKQIPPSSNELKDKSNWVVTRDNFESYLKRTRFVLKDTAEDVFSAQKIDAKYWQVYLDFINSAAWQESLLRQFEKKKGKVSYIRSYNGTSVGFMQINEKVWKDIYSVEKLRSDPLYNIRAGCEIAYLYLHRYTLPKMKKHGVTLSDANLARTLYAMYNGGPGEFFKFQKRLKSGKYYKSDSLYFEKYKWVTGDQWEKLTVNLFGR